MPDFPVDWREHYTALCREGEAKGLTFLALGHWIASGMTDPELRAMLNEWAPVLEGIRSRWGSATVIDPPSGEFTITVTRP